MFHRVFVVFLHGNFLGISCKQTPGSFFGTAQMSSADPNLRRDLWLIYGYSSTGHGVPQHIDSLIYCFGGVRDYGHTERLAPQFIKADFFGGVRHLFSDGRCMLSIQFHGRSYGFMASCG